MTEDDTFEALQLRIVIDKFGTKRYYNHENELHRKFGPAIVFADGTKMRYINGNRLGTDGDKYWFLNGKFHRVDGPAIVYADSRKEWFLNGQLLTEAEFLKHPLCTIK